MKTLHQQPRIFNGFNHNFMYFMYVPFNTSVSLNYSTLDYQVGLQTLRAGSIKLGPRRQPWLGGRYANEIYYFS